jgi:thiol:disulfide interchange protein
VFVRLVLALFILYNAAAVYAPAMAFTGGQVDADLVSDTEAVVLGQTLRLGVRLRMEEGWHTYWRHHGDAGAPTEITWHLPEGFSAGPLAWPAPEKYSEDGLIVFGYADETFLSSRIQVSETLLADTTLVFQAEVDWLVCREVCIPGGDMLRLEIPVRLGQAAPANEALFGRYDKRVPAELAHDARVRLGYNVTATVGNVLVNLDLEATGDEVVELVDFYPAEADAFIFHPPTKNVDNSGCLQLQLELYEAQNKVEVLPGLLVYRVGGKEKHHARVTLDLTRSSGQGGVVPRSPFVTASAPAHSFFVFVLMGMLGGLILNLMPCVLPVISLKVLSLVSQAGTDRAQVRRLGLLFSAGIILAFLGLAATVVALKAGGEQIGWGFQFQAPGFVVAMAALIFVLGLSLFGVFTVQLPGTQGSFGGLADGESGLSSFLNGILATILATPCTAPFLGAALGFAFAQEAGAIVTIFAAIGVGMALPYIALALQPGWMRFLPRPGAWMEAFKQFMGFMLMATVLWLLWVLGKQLGMEAVVWTGAFLLVLAVGAWIIGTWIDLRSSTGRRLGAWVLALGLSFAAYLLFVHPVLATMEAWEEGEVVSDEMDWQAFSSAKLEELIAQNRLIFVDFTAEWCLTCKVNERMILTQKRVRDKFIELDVALVKADWTRPNKQIKALLNSFGRSGVPLYVIYPKGHPEHPLVLPEIITVNLVLAKLDEANAAALERP